MATLPLGLTLTPINQALTAKAEARLQQAIAEDPGFAALLPDNELRRRMETDELTTSIEVVEATTKTYADRVAFKQCPPDGTWERDGRSVTYGEVWRRVERLATGLSEAGLVSRGKFMGIAGFASVDWAVGDIAALYLGAVVVPIPLNVPPSDMQHILNESETCCLLCSQLELPVLAKVLAECPTVSTVVVMDLQHPFDPATAPALPDTVTTVTTIDDLESRGVAASTFPAPACVPGRDGWPTDPLSGLMYTSGSTGAPKGAMYDERLVFQLWARGFNWSSAKTPAPAVSLAFLPLNHIAGRVTLYQTMVKGGLSVFVRRADMSTLFEDLAYTRPTQMMLVPRINNMIYETYQIRRAKALSEPGADVAAVEKEVRQWVRDEVLGGRLYSILSGTAPTAPEVIQFLRETCDAPVIDGYGSTECGGVTIDWSINHRTVLDAKLIDVPELGYFTSDRPPRGELCIRTRTGIKGYYKNPQATADLIDSEGYYHMGDIMEHRGGDMYVYIDRRKNVIKLSQGEFVSVSRVEAVYSGHTAIHQIYLYGNSRRSYLLAVIVPSTPWLEELKAALGGVQPSEPVVKEKLRAVVEAQARAEGLQTYEVPRDIIVEMEHFSRANSLLTDSNKPARGRLRQVYGPKLEALYEALEERHQQRLKQIRTDPAASAEDKVRAAVELTLGVEVPSMDATFRQLGGDSLASVRLADVLRDMTGVEVGVAVLLDPSVDLAQLTRVVEDGGLDDEEKLFRRVHGQGTLETIRAADLSLEHFIPSAELGAMAGGRAAQAGKDHAPRVVLLTGATGFLGRNLLLELLQRVSQRNGKVVCLVREASDEAARRRLLEGSLGDPETSELRKAVRPYESALEVLAGDVSHARLGLSESSYQRLCSEMDTVVHAGALVNHTFSYRQLFGPNVVGTATILRLCLTSRPKALHYISTVAAAFGAGVSSVTEEQLGSKLCTERPAAGHYAAGYGVSKWAGEVLLEQAHASTGLPISVYRCSMILPHARLARVVNTSDVFTRIVYGLVATGLAPRSFFQQGAKPQGYDGNSVDLVTGAVASIADARLDGLHLYHVVNPHVEHGASMDTIAQWIESAGYAMRRIEDYDTWFAQFKERLEVKSEKERAKSPLPVIDQWRQPSRGLGHGARLDAKHFREAVKLYMGLDDVPTLTESYMQFVLRSMVGLGVIPAAAQE